jgi:putative endonuclease
MNDKVPQTPGYLYILSNERGSVLYVGCTTNLVKRVYAHKKGLVPGFTKRYNVKRLVYFEQHQNIGQARTREKHLKGKTRAKKIALVRSSNPRWRDLTPEVER